MTVKLIIEYDGTDYNGWQSQRSGNTVQQKIEEALRTLAKRRITVMGSGRTDSGVHAEGQVASFCADGLTIPPERYAPALNALLPDNIRVRKSEAAADGFNARRAAKRKTYRYGMYVSAIDRPLLDRYAVRVGAADVKAMRRAAEALVGEHDFKAFCASNSSVKTTVRTVYSVEIEQHGELITISVCGNGFLYNMVRIIAGTLAAVGEGRLAPEKVSEILENGARKNAGKTMPARGLTLLRVEYD